MDALRRRFLRSLRQDLSRTATPNSPMLPLRYQLQHEWSQDWMTSRKYEKQFPMRPGDERRVASPHSTSTGTYGRSATAYGPYGSATKSAAYNPTTGQAAAGGSKSSAYGSAGAVTTSSGASAAGFSTANSQGAVAKDSSGKVSVTPLPGQRVRLNFADYIKPGDSLALDIDLANNRPVEARVATYLDSPTEAVTLDVRFSALDNNATYVANIVLNAKAKNLTVNVQNSGYRPAGR